MSRKPLALALLGLAALAVAGCRRDTPDDAAASAPPPAAEVAVAPATAPAPPSPDVVTVVENTAADAITYNSKGFDARAFAGAFSGPVAAGAQGTLSLSADGNFVLIERRPQAEAVTIDGTWTAEQDGRRIRLDPASKAENDRLYAIVSDDQLRMLDADGKPLAGGDASLRRESGAQ